MTTTEKMKVLVICGTHKKNKKQSSSWFLLEKALEHAQEIGAEIDAINFADYNILPCRGCNLCMTGETCPQLKKCNDETLKVVERIRWADGIIFSYPVYGLHPPGVLCNFIGGRGKAFLGEDKAMTGEQPLGKSTIFTGKIIGSIVNAGGFGMEPVLIPSSRHSFIQRLYRLPVQVPLSVSIRATLLYNSPAWVKTLLMQGGLSKWQEQWHSVLSMCTILQCFPSSEVC